MMKGFFHNRNSVRRGGGRKSQKRHLSTSQGQHSTTFCATEEENSEAQEHLKNVCKPSSEGVTVATNRQLFPSRDHLISLYHINFIINDIIDIMYIYTYTYILINICKPCVNPSVRFHNPLYWINQVQFHHYKAYFWRHVKFFSLAIVS